MAYRYSIRMARRADEPAIQHIELSAAQRFHDVGMPEVTTHVGMTTELIERFIERGVLFVCTLQREPVAFVAGCLLDGSGHIAEVDVLPEHAGKRLGSRLIDRVAMWAEQRGAKQLTLTTYRDVPWNAPYYAQLGFTECALDTLGLAHHEVWEGQRGMGLDMARRLIMSRPIVA